MTQKPCLIQTTVGIKKSFLSFQDATYQEGYQIFV